MILVDSSVWIDFFNGQKTYKTDILYKILDQEIIVTGDLICIEILQGFKIENEYKKAKRALDIFPCYALSNPELYIKVVDNFRFLRKKGITVRKTIDMIIGTYCVENEIQLLHDDKDFDPMEKHLGLQVIS